MKLLVQKFGGTSVATPAAREAVYGKIQQARQAGDSLVVVLSAMGRKGEPYATDTLLELFSGGQKLPNSREQDMIYACGEIISGSVIANELRQRQIPAVLLTGGQARIMTNDHYSSADIQTIHLDNIHQWLQKGYVVLVTGGQGVTEQGDFTSIGRGGSDTTACALGYYLDADEVQIYTDVNGIYTGDPRIIKNARPIPAISYEQCRRLAEYGAKVIHPKAVAFSQKGAKNVLSVRSTFTDDSGTKIGDYDCDSVGITALRDQLCYQLPVGQSSLDPAALCYHKDESLAYYCSDAKNRELLPALPQTDPLDVIFAVGAQVQQKLQHSQLPQDLCRQILSPAEDVAVFLVEPEKYIQAINLLHDSLCI